MRVGLGTFIAIEARACDEPTAQLGIDVAFAAVATVEKLMHPHRVGSDVAALSASKPGAPLPLHSWTRDVLALCMRLHGLSRGAFDPCLDSAPGRLSDLILTQDGSAHVRRRLCIDLGGIAKGFAVDRAIAALRDQGCVEGLVNAGGDLAVFGARGHEVLCRARGNQYAILTLRNAALASSDAGRFEQDGALLQSRPAEHRGYYHGTDRSVRVGGKATVTAASAAVADGLTKCLLFGDTDADFAPLLNAFGARLIDW